LARIRAERQGAHHRPPTPEPSRRLTRSARAAESRILLRLELHDRLARRRATILGAGHKSRLSCDNFWLAGRGSHPADYWQERWQLLPRRTRASTRARLPYWTE